MLNLKKAIAIAVLCISLISLSNATEWYSDWSYLWIADTTSSSANTPHRCGIRIQNQQITVFAECRFDAALLKSLRADPEETTIQWCPVANYLNSYDVGSANWITISMGNTGYWEYTSSALTPQAGTNYTYQMNHNKKPNPNYVSYVEWGMSISTDSLRFDADFSGPSTLNVGQSGTFTASYNSDICPPTMFKWYRKDLSGNEDYELIGQGANLSSISTTLGRGCYHLKLVLENSSNNYQEEVVKEIVGIPFFNADFSGPTTLNEGQSGTFTASYISDLYPPTMFKWYRKDLGWGLSGKGMLMTPPCEDEDFVLIGQGANLSSMSTTPNCGCFQLKLVLENSSDNYQEEVVKEIVVFSELKQLDKNSVSSNPVQLSISSSPNPFNQIAEIQYALPNHGPVNMVIYNLMGETVKELTHATLESGIHRVAWDGTDRHGQKVKSGVYFCRILTNQGTAVAKILCTR